MPDDRRNLDQPVRRRAGIRPSVDSERFGALSESVARHIGSWAFILWMTIAIVIWIERTYHRRRRQRGLGRLTPIEYETLNTAAQAA